MWRTDFRDNFSRTVRFQTSVGQIAARIPTSGEARFRSSPECAKHRLDIFSLEERASLCLYRGQRPIH